MKSTVLPKLKVILPLFLSLTALGPRAFAQVNSSTSAVTLSATLAPSIGITTSASTFTWTALTPGALTPAGAPITITTTWSLGADATVELDAYFASATQSMTDGSSHYIPAAKILGAVGGGAAAPITANTQTGTAGAGLIVFSQAVTSSTYTANRTDSLALSINLAGLTIPPGTYTGTLTLKAQAF